MCMIQESVGLCAYECGELCSLEWEVLVSECVLSGMRWILHPIAAIKIKTNLALHSVSLTPSYFYANKQ